MRNVVRACWCWLVIVLALGCSDGGGVDRYTQQLVSVDAAGTGCTGAGWTWVAATKTCLMTADAVNEYVSLDADDTVLDCAGWTICNVVGADCSTDLTNTISRAVASIGHTGVAVKNCVVKGFADAAVYLEHVDGATVRNLKTIGGSYYANPAPDTAWAKRQPDNAIELRFVDNSLFEELEFSGVAEAAIEAKYGGKYNTFRKIYAKDLINHGFYETAAATSSVVGNLLEDVILEFVDGRVDWTGVNIYGNNNTVRRLFVYPRPNVAEAGYGIGAKFGGTGNIIEQSAIVGARNAGITQWFNSGAKTFTVRDNVVTHSGGGVTLDSTTAAIIVLEGNTFCNDPADRFVYQTATSDIRNADITRRLPLSGPPGTVQGSNNVCGYTNNCQLAAAGTGWTCVDLPAVDMYHDVDAPNGQFCRHSCKDL